MKKVILFLLFSLTLFNVYAQTPAITNTSFFKFEENGNFSKATGAQLRAFIGAGSGSVTSVALSGGTTGLTFGGSPITTSGTMTASGTLTAANGGTGATSLTGYVKGAGTAAMTASATIPAADISGSITNAQLANSSVTNTVANSGTSIGFSAATTALGGTQTLNIPIATPTTTTGVLSNTAQSVAGTKTFVNGAVSTGVGAVEALFIDGAVRNKQATITSATVLDGTYNNLNVSATTATYSVTLPLCTASNLGVSYSFIRTDATTTTSVNIVTSGSDGFIGGGASRNLNGQGVSIECTCAALAAYIVKW